jgi:transposase
MEIITGVERRRRWSLAEKLRIVAEMEQPGAPGINEFVRRYDVSRGLLWNWRSQVRRGVLKPEPPPVFLPVQTIGKPIKQPRCEPCPVVLGDQDESGSL